MPESKFSFSVSGRPGDSPEVGPVTSFEQCVLPANRSTLVAVCERVAKEWTETAQYGCADALDVASLYHGFLSRLLQAVSAYDPEHADSQIVFKDTTTDESAWVTIVRVYFVDPEEVE